MPWIEIPRWDEFQHRDMARSSIPPWVKTYTKLLSDDDFLELSFHRRGLLISLWLEYARARRQLSGSTVALSRRLGHRVTVADLQALIDAGYITLSDSKPASTPASTPASLEVEVEVEKKKPLHVKSKTKPVCPHCQLELNGPLKLAEHVYLQHDGPEPAHWLEAESRAAH